MRTKNYIRLEQTLGAYRAACDAHHAYPKIVDYADAVIRTQDNLLCLPEDLLWEECPEDIRPERSPNDLPD